MFNPLSKMNVSDLGLDADLLEAAMKVKKESAYNPSCAMDDLKAEPSGSTPDAMKVNIAYEAKKKIKKEQREIVEEKIVVDEESKYEQC